MHKGSWQALLLPVFSTTNYALDLIGGKVIYARGGVKWVHMVQNEA